MSTFDLIEKTGCEIKRKENLRNYTTMKIGGTAEFLLKPKNIGQLIEIMKIVITEKCRYVFIGNGSNLLIDDGYFDGIVITASECDEICLSGEYGITAECGISLNRLCIFAKNNSLTGFEFAYGIPGTVGGAVYMNAGAFDGQMSDVIHSTTYLDIADLTIKTLTGDEHGFEYRTSIFRHTGNIILSARLNLRKGYSGDIEEKMNEYNRRRKEKQPLEYPSAGSVFKRYPGYYTAQLIDECGLKGQTVGGAMVSFKHAGFIVNKGNASFNDVVKLIEIIKRTVYEKKGIDIECEIKIMRFGE